MEISDLRDLSLLIGIWVAIYGIDSWRREFQGKRQLALAEETLALFYEAADAIAAIRSPIGHSGEYEGVTRGEHEPEDQFEARKRASVVFYRYKQYSELFGKLHSMRYRFMAAFGREGAKPFLDIHRKVHEIILAARMLAHFWARNFFEDDKAREKHWEQVQKYEAFFWHQGEQDTFQPQVEDIVQDIDTICRNIIVGTGTIHGFLNQQIGRGR